ncbi:grpE protein homolog 2, mitochondrial-like isoform X3 [Olea europaea var. sylvestris]|uniref:grpE protein homolog 2, mitochondrial-like isoform X3 n=1 Tax=Olea europaea var. sylvestris TaxID=158386 RepID=UPI000C1D0614|nr:grpE protein homolog 2, mitochondrial-like isoform X3 [Olea europaea var. sylvestris]
MSLGRITSRFSRTVLTQCRSSQLLCDRHDQMYFRIISNQFLSPTGSQEKVSLLGHSTLNSSTFQWFGFSSSASPHPNEKENAESENKQENKRDDGANAAAVDVPDQSEASVSDQKDESDLESDLSRDDLMKLLAEKEELLKVKQIEHEQMKDKVLRTLAEMENVKDRTKREADNAKKFAIQNFAKSLLDVADNLGRASSAAKESFSKIETSNGAPGAVTQLKTLLEGVEMTEKQLIEVFKKFGVEKYDVMNEEFDPNRHNAVFQVPDASKPANHVAVVLKAGYMLHDRVIRPAEVGVTVAVDNVDADK